MDGSDLIGQLRHLRSVPDFKVLALTPAANPEAVLPPLLNQRVDAGLRLPVDPQTLLHQVNLLMGTQTALQSE
jgi:response regulator RpfG family c-di-GMP phosphodiesterase